VSCLPLGIPPCGRPQPSLLPLSAIGVAQTILWAETTAADALARARLRDQEPVHGADQSVRGILHIKPAGLRPRNVDFCRRLGALCRRVCRLENVGP